MASKIIGCLFNSLPHKKQCSALLSLIRWSPADYSHRGSVMPKTFPCKYVIMISVFLLFFMVNLLHLIKYVISISILLTGIFIYHNYFDLFTFCPRHHTYTKLCWMNRHKRGSRFMLGFISLERTISLSLWYAFMGLSPDMLPGCARVGNARNVSLATAGERSRHVSRHVRDCTCRDAYRDR